MSAFHADAASVAVSPGLAGAAPHDAKDHAADDTAHGTAQDAASTSATRRVLIWDVPVRVFHALMIVTFAGAWLTAESERWRLAHVSLGYALAALVAFRVVWGFVGTRHARFAGFVRGPSAVWRYLRSLLGARPEHHVGHNPAGAMAIIGLLALGALTAVTGWATYEEVGGEWLEDLHEGAANAMLLLVAVHVLGVVVSSILHRENLVAAMVHGYKRAPASLGITTPRRVVALVMFAAVVAVAWWPWSSAQGPLQGDGAASTAMKEQGRAKAGATGSERSRRRDDDD